MKYVINILGAVILSINISGAQTGFGTKDGMIFMKDETGNQLYAKTNYRIEGSPFYPNEYCSANIKVANGKWFEDVKIKLYLIDNLVYCLSDNSKELVVDMPIEKINFLNCMEGITGTGNSFQSGFSAIDKQTDKTFYKVLDSGNAKLLQYLNVTYSDEKPFNTAGITRVFKTAEILYANLPGNKMVKLNRNKESVISALADKKNLVEAFIDSKGLKCKKEEDITMVFNYYNSL